MCSASGSNPEAGVSHDSSRADQHASPGCEITHEPARRLGAKLWIFCPHSVDDSPVAGKCAETHGRVNISERTDPFVRRTVVIFKHEGKE
jgi:hypothetical protein